MILFSAEFFFEGVDRWQLWLDNPNKAAIVFAEFAILGVWLIQRRKARLFWYGYVLMNISAFALLHTISRGGLIACVIGLAFAIRRSIISSSSGGKKLLVVLSLILLFISMFCLKVHQRCMRGVIVEDASIKNRLVLWSSAPAMFRAAPWGWGLGNAGDAYMKWFQPTDRQERYRTLVNSHLTWLVELGWGLGFLYLCAWSCALWFGWKIRKKTVDQGLCLSEMACLFVGGMFSSVLESTWVWVLPTMALCISFRNIMSSVRLATAKDIVLIVCIASVVMFGFAAFPSSGNLPIRKYKDHVLCGDARPLICLFPDTQVLGGELYMRELRDAMNTCQGAVAVVANAKDVPKTVDMIVLSGEECRKIDGLLQLNLCCQILLISPQAETFSYLYDKNIDKRILIWIGELSGIPCLHGDSRIVEFPGASQYIPLWAEHMFEAWDNRESIRN